MRRPASSRPSRPAAVVAVSARPSMSSAVGPKSTLPYTVGATNTPFVRSVGTGSTMEDTSPRASLSKTMSWPRRGAMVNSSWPKRRLRTSAPRPPALTTQPAADRSPRGVQQPLGAVAPDVGDLCTEPELHAGADRLGGEGDARAPRADDRLVRDGDGPRRPLRQVRLPSGELGEVHPDGRFVAVGPGLGDDVVETRRLLRVPGHQHGSGLLDRDPRRPRVRGQQFVTAADEGGLKASGLRVEAGVHNGGIGLRGAGADIVGALEQHGAQSIAGQLASDGGADDSGPDDGDVVAPNVGHGGHGDAGESGPRRDEPRRARSPPTVRRPRQRSSPAHSVRRAGPSGRRHRAFVRRRPRSGPVHPRRPQSHGARRRPRWVPAVGRPASA